jgi:hypothetical protein
MYEEERTSDISNPITEPLGPTLLADKKTSTPPPDPRSTTISPYKFGVRVVHTQGIREMGRHHLLDVCGGNRITTA